MKFLFFVLYINEISFYQIYLILIINSNILNQFEQIN